jgi:hypothetical protein
VLSLGFAAFGFMNPAALGFSATAHLGAALAGLSLGSTVWQATHKPAEADSTSRFDVFANTVSSDVRIPVIYGTRKWAGAVSYHMPSANGKNLDKDIIIAEGPIQGIYGVSANELSISSTSLTGWEAVLSTGSIGKLHGIHTYPIKDTHVFSLVNLKYSDATIEIVNGGPTGNDKTLTLYANGKTTNILLQHPSDLHDIQDNDFSCYIYKLINYISGIGYSTTLDTEGWLVVNASITTDPPENIGIINTIGCYNAPISVGIGTMASASSHYDLHLGATTDSPPDNYLKVGGYRNMAWLRAKLVQSDALQGGSPNITYICQGMQILDTRTGVIGYSENPAMIVRNYLLSKRYGCGHFVSLAELDEDAFKEAADYCDELVTFVDHNGNTITEPRYTLNIIIDQKKKHIEILQDMFANFGGYLVFTNNHIGLRVERSTPVSYAFTDDTIVADSIVYSGASTDQLPNRYNITYNDPNQNWTGIKCIVEDTVGQQSYPVGRGKIIPLDVALAGCTRQSQASRLGRLMRDIAILCPLRVQFKTSTMAMHLEPGDVVTITKNLIVNGVSQILFQDMPFRIMEISNNKGIYTIKGQQYNDSVYNDSLGAKIVVKNYVQIASPVSDPVPNVTNLDILESFRDIGNGIITTDAEITWSHIDTFYREAEVYVLSDNPTWDEIEVSTDDLDGTWESLGQSSGVWKLVGKGYDRLFMTNLVKGIKYTFKIVDVNTMNRKANFDGAPAIEVIIKSKTYTPSTPTGLTVNITDKCEWHWNNLDLDCDFAELRTDTNTGNIIGLLAKTSSTKAIATPPTRHGLVYLYAHNKGDYYSDPCVYEYNQPAPIAPTNVEYKLLFQGIQVTTEALPSYSLGINVHANDGTGDKVFFSPNNTFKVPSTGGIFDMRVGFVDIFGEGLLSQVVEVVLKATMDPALLAAESLSLDKMDVRINETIAKGEIGYDNSVNIISELGKDIKDCGYTAIARASDAIQLRAKSAELLSLINVCPEAITIKSSLVHITGDTLFDNNVIVNGMLSANSVTTSKLIAGIGITSPTITGGTIIGGRIQNAGNTAYIDGNGNIHGVNITGATIDAGSVYSAGYQIKASVTIRGSVANGGYIPLPDGFVDSQCTWGSMGLVNNYGDITTATIYANRYVTAVSRDSVTGQTWSDSLNYWCTGVR